MIHIQLVQMYFCWLFSNSNATTHPPTPQTLASTVENSEGIVCISPGNAPLVSFAIEGYRVGGIHGHFKDLGSPESKKLQPKKKKIHSQQGLPEQVVASRLD